MTELEQASLVNPHLNNGLFADYYLNARLTHQPEWDQGLRKSGALCFGEIKALRAKVHPEALDEPQLEKQWVQPVLDLLGHHYTVQGKIRYRDRFHRKPDYVFLASEAEMRAVTSEVYEPHQITNWLAVGDAKRWGVKLDQAQQGERSPSQQIDEYLRYSERPWGILTDGRYWRLYHRDSSKYNRYYAVDLQHLLGDEEAFLYFYAFFRLEAFTTGWLEKVLVGSEEFAQRLTDQLEGEVFDALEMIAQGFLDYRRNQLSADTATLRTIYEQSLVLLYRLLFIFYAESREILPVENREYRSRISMDSIKREAANDLRFNKTFDPDSSHYYGRLRDLFFAVDAGHTRYGVPPYNGRLFSDGEHPFLREYVVGDAHLVPALDRLARVDDSGQRVFVDYRDLEVRHLGSIYEKLLEYELAVAAEPLTTRGDKERYETAGEGDAIVKQQGEVYLKTGSNERKVTGSYYTPDYIVRFIVEKTLEPLLAAITERHADLNEDGSWRVREGEADALVNEILSLNVLDPATGSGHFVVDATAYIAEWLRGLAIRPADLGDEDELIYWKRLVASACIYAVDINPLAVELAKLSMWLATLAKGKPLSFLDHHIRLGNSLVGTRMSAIDDESVSVRDEERRRRARERQRQKQEEVGQIPMFSDADFSAGVQFAVQQMSAIEHTVARDVADVKHQEELYAALTKRLSAWKQAADVWTARYFGLELTADDWKAVRSFSASGMMPPAVQTIVDEAERIAQAQRFFHWELAFPEIFYDADGQPKANPGFDAVVGNPPYVRQERIQPIKPFLEKHYDVYSGTADLFLYFYERGIQFLKPDYRLGYITSGTYMNSNSANPFRRYIHNNTGLEWVANFGENQPFRGAEMVYPTMAVLRSGKPRETFRNLFIEGTVPYAQLGEAVEKGEWADSLSEATGMEEWRFQPKEIRQLFLKLITGDNRPLAKVIDGRLYYGVKTGRDEVFLITEQQRQALIQEHESSKEVIKPLLRGQDIRPWYQQDSGLYLIFTRQGIDIDAFPAIKRYLEQYRQTLMPKPDNWQRSGQGEWQGRKGGAYEWYEIQDNVAYFEEFDKPKVVWPIIGKLPRFAWDSNGAYVKDTGFILIPRSIAMLAILQSRPIWFALSQFATPLRLRAGLWQYQGKVQFVERLPIPELTADQESSLAALAEEITGLAKARYQMHEDVRRTITGEFGGGTISTRVDLYRWWELADEKVLSDQIKQQLGQEIPLMKRAEWRGFLDAHKAEHARLTSDIIARETRLNAIVYDAFNLTPEERDLIERTTKYPYGEV